jgi:hypothetical protein
MEVELMTLISPLARIDLKLNHLKIIDFPQPRGPVSKTGVLFFTSSSQGHEVAKSLFNNTSLPM